MEKKIQTIALIIIITILASLLSSYFYTTNAVTQTVSSNISSIDNSKYPGFKSLIQALQKEHPNWNFEILYTGIDWSEAITYEYTGHRQFT